eukprot:m.94344 g.94344  ORF g.94344 m.94344 type:complete len:1189 (-) comp13022_c2_seq3:253-3819(-)
MVRAQVSRLSSMLDSGILAQQRQAILVIPDVIRQQPLGHVITPLLLKVATIFQFCPDSALKWDVCRCMVECGPFLSHAPALDTISQRFVTVLQSNDEVSRAITFRILAVLATLLPSNASLQFAVIDGIQRSSCDAEVCAAIDVAECLCPISPTFRTTMFSIVLEKVQDVATPTPVKLKLIHLMRFFSTSPSQLSALLDTCWGLLRSSCIDLVSDALLASMEPLMTQATSDVGRHVDNLLNFLSREAHTMLVVPAARLLRDVLASLGQFVTHSQMLQLVDLIANVEWRQDITTTSSEEATPQQAIVLLLEALDHCLRMSVDDQFLDDLATFCTPCSTDKRQRNTDLTDQILQLSIAIDMDEKLQQGLDQLSQHSLASIGSTRVLATLIEQCTKRIMMQLSVQHVAQSPADAAGSKSDAAVQPPAFNTLGTIVFERVTDHLHALSAAASTQITRAFTSSATSTSTTTQPLVPTLNGIAQLVLSCLDLTLSHPSLRLNILGKRMLQAVVEGLVRMLESVSTAFQTLGDAMSSTCQSETPSACAATQEPKWRNVFLVLRGMRVLLQRCTSFFGTRQMDQDCFAACLSKQASTALVEAVLQLGTSCCTVVYDIAARLYKEGDEVSSYDDTTLYDRASLVAECAAEALLAVVGVVCLPLPESSLEALDGCAVDVIDALTVARVLQQNRQDSEVAQLMAQIGKPETASNRGSESKRWLLYCLARECAQNSLYRAAEQAFTACLHGVLVEAEATKPSAHTFDQQAPTTTWKQRFIQVLGANNVAIVDDVATSLASSTLAEDLQLWLQVVIQLSRAQRLRQSSGFQTPHHKQQSSTALLKKDGSDSCCSVVVARDAHLTLYSVLESIARCETVSTMPFDFQHHFVFLLAEVRRATQLATDTSAIRSESAVSVALEDISGVQALCHRTKAQFVLYSHSDQAVFRTLELQLCLASLSLQRWRLELCAESKAQNGRHALQKRLAVDAQGCCAQLSEQMASVCSAAVVMSSLRQLAECYQAIASTGVELDGLAREPTPKRSCRDIAVAVRSALSQLNRVRIPLPPLFFQLDRQPVLDMALAAPDTGSIIQVSTGPVTVKVEGIVHYASGCANPRFSTVRVWLAKPLASTTSTTAEASDVLEQQGKASRVSVSCKGTFETQFVLEPGAHDGRLCIAVEFVGDDGTVWKPRSTLWIEVKGQRK